MKEVIKMVVNHFFIITTGILSVLGISNLISGTEGYYPIMFPIKVLIMGATSALPSFLFYFRKEPSRKQFFIRVILHFFCILAVVFLDSYLLGWVSEISDLVIVAIDVVLVYILVWGITMYSNSKVEKGINEALKNYNSDEEE